MCVQMSVHVIMYLWGLLLAVSITFKDICPNEDVGGCLQGFGALSQLLKVDFSKMWKLRKCFFRLLLHTLVDSGLNHVERLHSHNRCLFVDGVAQSKHISVREKKIEENPYPVVL